MCVTPFFFVARPVNFRRYFGIRGGTGCRFVLATRMLTRAVVLQRVFGTLQNTRLDRDDFGDKIRIFCVF